ncbi:MAG TPA: EamA family transporter [Azospirillaceae bacterium]|nr:EamA family transporter [Azospirillaceae bacterium]
MTLAATSADRGRATLVGAGAVALWSSLALLATMTGPLPPFQVTAITIAVGALVGMATSIAGGRNVLAPLRQRPSAWLLGVAGLFGYHALYFVALRLAPPVEANLINYLWPLLIVVFSGLLPGERLGRAQLAGAALGLAGTALVVTGGDGLSVQAAHLPGYLAALSCAVVWAAYSVLSRLFGDVPTDAVSGFCLVTSLLAALCHLAFETWVPPSATDWVLLLVMGLGPLGAAFFLWDHGVKRGDIQVLGAVSYSTPLLSTLLLVVSGRAAPSLAVLAATVLIVGGAFLASRGLMRKDPHPDTH